MDSVPGSILYDVRCTAQACRYNPNGICIVYRTIEPEPERVGVDGSPYTYTQCHEDMKLLYRRTGGKR